MLSPYTPWKKEGEERKEREKERDIGREREKEWTKSGYRNIWAHPALEFTESEL